MYKLLFVVIFKEILLAKAFLMIQELFQTALNINTPWFVTDLNFDIKSKRLDIYLDFTKGSTFSYEDIDYKKELKQEIIG